MKNIFKKITIASTLLVVLSGCDSAFVSSVKDAEYDNELTIEDLFEESNFCDSISWSEIENKKYKRLVHLECEVKKEKQVFKGYDILVYNFKNINDTVDIFNSYYKNIQGKTVGRVMTKWQSELMLEGLQLQVAQNK